MFVFFTFCLISSPGVWAQSQGCAADEADQDLAGNVMLLQQSVNKERVSSHAFTDSGSGDAEATGDDAPAEESVEADAEADQVQMLLQLGSRPGAGPSNTGLEISCQPGSGGWPACATSPTTHGPQHGSCTPQCTWQCDSPRCDEICYPECQPPQCETRCSGIDTSACVMECGEPSCAVACPANQCPSRDCPACTASCSEPSCHLRCPNNQPCRNVCEQPQCQWRCHAPEECPAPQCHMVCETPQNCMGSTYRQLPPLAPGETSVQSFAAPLSFLQLSSTTDADAPATDASTLEVQLFTFSEQGNDMARTVTLPMISKRL